MRARCEGAPDPPPRAPPPAVRSLWAFEAFGDGFSESPGRCARAKHAACATPDACAQPSTSAFGNPKLPCIPGAGGSPTAKFEPRDVIRGFRSSLAPAAARRQNSNPAATATLEPRDVIRGFRVLLAPAAAEPRNSNPAATLTAFAHYSRKRVRQRRKGLLASATPLARTSRKPPLIGGLGGRNPKP